MSEIDRVWDMLQRCYEGNAWHGPALRELLEIVEPKEAAAHPVPGARSIWELTLHLTVLEDGVRRRLQGEAMPELTEEQCFPTVEAVSREAWQAAVEAFEESHQSLRRALASFPDARIDDTVPGRDYPFYLMLYGVIQHELYHAGQIEVLLQAQGRRVPGAVPAIPA